MKLAALAAATPLVAGVSAAATGAAAGPSASGVSHRAAHVCAKPQAGYAACAALVRVDGKGKPAVTPAPKGYGPADIQGAYKLDKTSGAGKTVAIVDAYDDPTAESDLGVYRSQYGLPACTTANGCFAKVNQSGVSRNYPRVNGGWAQEISLDLDMV